MICSRGYPRFGRNKNVGFVRLKDTTKGLVLQVNEGGVEGGHNDGGEGGYKNSCEGGHNDKQYDDEVELTLIDFDASSNGDVVNGIDDATNGVDAYNVNINEVRVQNEVMEGLIQSLLNKI
ncbi:unnamed protein product [Lactuca saligna]|uniref:Uncharacterized protein n=1 Tax=Lactuca saligna TaxID=75948 RepID=A0AA35VQH4_LACSI|nr:unnamed protein product [Lactuca saligna]